MIETNKNNFGESEVISAKLMQLRFTHQFELQLKAAEDWLTVVAKPCFPWSQPIHFISLIDLKGDEIGMVEGLEDLCPSSREALEKALTVSQFIFVITEIEEISEEFSFRLWRVQTTSGSRVFQTKLNHWPDKFGDGQVHVRDMYGDSYVIEDPDKLSEESQKLLWPLID